MFTTPATASEPYTAEAPSLSTSIRSIIAAGMLLRSTEPPRPGAQRLPLTRTRVRFEPIPRMLIVVVPLPPLLLLVLIAEPAEGIA